ncbi:hypothetical protein [Spiroplasma endosymbiont of Apeira syringaria]|uniref:hypothetical protein n=1 Tax=Spiroplasma endosymbiont of Apeira syringaria TaxID=3066307 RepID=UPI0030D335C7
MQDIAVQFEKHFWIHSVSLFPPQVHVGRSPIMNLKIRPILIASRSLTKIDTNGNFIINDENLSKE